MANVNPQLNIQHSEKLSVESNLFDVRLILDLGREAIRHKKDFVLPVELECFLPYGFDVLSNDNQDSKNIHNLLGIEEQLSVTDKKKQEDFKKDVLIIGNSKAVNVYPSVAKILNRSNLIDFKDKSYISRESYKKDDEILLFPLKLMLATITYEQLTVEDTDEKELMDLLLDKITLAALLPYFADDAFWPGILKEDGTSKSYTELKAQMLQKLEEKNPLSNYIHSSMLEEKYAIKLNKNNYWQSLVNYTLDREDDHAKILFPIDLLDEILTDHLQTVFLQLKKDKDGDKQFIAGIESLEKLGLPAGIRTDYGFFYPVIDEFLKKQNVRSGLQLLKQKYNAKDISGFLPFVEEIDLRPINWAKEAMQVTTEMNIAAQKYRWAKEGFKRVGPQPDQSLKDLPSMEQVSNEFRKASSEWFMAKSRYEHLKNRVGKEGIELTLQEQASADGVKIDQFFTLTRKRLEAKNVILQRRHLEKWTENYTVRRCKRSFFSKRCWNEYRSREVSRWRTWYDTVVQYYNVNKPINIDYDPIGSYLEMNINTNAVGNIDEAKKLGKALHLSDEQVSNISETGTSGGRSEYGGLLNSHKEVHIFDFIDGEYRDQNGIPLSILLRELENFTSDGLGIIPGQKKLFIIPQLIKTVTGETLVEKYLAVHNPLGGRRTNLAPNLFIVETYRQTIQQVPGHWLGKLSHTTCLFPGEARTLKMVTESRYESNLSQNSTSKKVNSFRQKEDVRDQVRNELERENKSSETKNWAVSASGGASWGAGSAKASASASGSKTNSSSHLAKSLNDKVSKALNDISSNNEVQFVTTSTEKKSVSSTSESVVELKNVNQGRSINYKFFQILHKYVSKVVLEDLKVVVEYGHEIIPGLDVVQTKVYHLAELEEMLPELIEEERQSVKKQLLALIQKRYQHSLISGPENNFIDIDRDKAITEEETLVNSGSFYLDNEVSQLPATEEYVELVRAAELEKFKAECLKIQSESTAISGGKVLFPKEVNSLNLYGWQYDHDKMQDGQGEVRQIKVKKNETAN